MGGAKVVYRHAAGLVARGHEVTVLAPERSGSGVIAFARRIAVAARDRRHGVSGVHAYEASGVTTLDIPYPDASHVPDADIVVATGVQTAPWVASWPESKGRKVYFVQGDETFVQPDARTSWHLGMHLVTVAAWLASEMEAAGLSPLGVVPNAVAPEEFGLDTPLEQRDPALVGLYHRHPVKGPDVLLAAIDAVQRQRPDVSIELFSARPPSHKIPEGVRVHIRPSQDELRALYNRSRILLHPSRSESMPLVPMEAAACGCAIVASDNRGVHEYLASGESMLTAPLGDGDALAAQALVLLHDDARRQRLAEHAHASVSALNWEASTDRFEAALRSVVR